MNEIALRAGLQADAQFTAEEAARGAAGRRPRAPRSVFACLQLYMAAIVLAGFAPSFYLQPERAMTMHWIIHVHAGVMTLWIAFMAVQGVLPATGRTALHRTLGWWGAGVAGLVMVTGVMITVKGVHDAWDPFGLGSGEAFAAIPFRDLVTFGTFFAVGLLTRKSAPEAHKRMMTLATLSVIPAGLARMAAYTPEWGITVLNHAPIAVMIAWDLWTRRRVLTSTWLGSGFLVAMTPLCIAMSQTGWWVAGVQALT